MLQVKASAVRSWHRQNNHGLLNVHAQMATSCLALAVLPLLPAAGFWSLCQARMSQLITALCEQKIQAQTIVVSRWHWFTAPTSFSSTCLVSAGERAVEALSSIDEQVVPMFREAAKSLLAELEPEVALALALAKITGHTQLRVSCAGVGCWWQLSPPSVGFGTVLVSAMRVCHASFSPPGSRPIPG